MISNFKKIGLTIVITIFGFLTVNAQTQTKSQMQTKTQMSSPKVIALVNKASWCHVCKDNSPRVEKDIMPMLQQDKNVQLVVNDLSNKESIAQSLPMINKAGISKFASENKGTGMIYFIDANTKKLISSASLADSDADITMAYKNAVSKNNMPKHGEKGHVCDANCKTKM